MTGDALVITGLTVSLGKTRVLTDVDLHIPAGKVCGLLGPNGSGKSTLLRSIFRAVRPRSGKVVLVGQDGVARDVWRMTVRDVARRVASVTQHWEPAFDVTVRDVVAMGRFPHRGDWQRINLDDQAVVEEALDAMDLTALARRSVSKLSGGERQRVLLARAIAQQPAVLLLDEPTNHLDVRHQFELLEIVSQLGVTALIALHDLDMAARCCDLLAVLDQGEVVAAGAPARTLDSQLIANVWGVRAEIETAEERRSQIRIRLLDLAEGSGSVLAHQSGGVA